MTKEVQAILRTVVLFDIVHTPLTSLEIWKYLVAPSGFTDLGEVDPNSSTSSSAKPLLSYGELVRLLSEDSVLEEKLGKKDGFYALRGRVEELVQKRHQGNVVAIRHWRILQTWGERLRSVPFLRLFAGCNLLAVDRLDDDSDIDIFLVAREGRLWLVRFLVNASALLHGDRITENHRAERLCLSMNAADKSGLDLLEQTKKPNDPYMVLWIALLRPILNFHDVFSRFLKSNDSWMKGSMPHLERVLPNVSFWQGRSSSWRSGLRRVFEVVLGGWLGDLTERFAKVLQMRHLRKTGRSESRGNDVVVSNSLLKFHVNDARDVIREKYEGRLREIGVV